MKIALGILLCVTACGCASIEAATGPGKIPVRLFRPGTSRATLHEEFGEPLSSLVRDDGYRYEEFCVTQGYSSWNKAGRAVGHGAAFVVTYGLWDFVGTPAEALLLDGKQMIFQVTYDEKDCVRSVIQPKEKRFLPENAGQAP